jgi:ABC-type multidrug transport system ATPase subunit
MTIVGRSIEVAFSGTTILHGIDFRAERGNLIGVLGPSGSGKSTLLFALSGFRKANSGTVTLDGRSLYDAFEEMKSDIGFVPQDDIVPTSLTVERVLRYAADLRLPDFDADAREGRVSGVIQALGLGERRDLRVSKLSGGQRKRVSVGVELLTRPDFLFADEPTSGLDPALERSLMESLKNLAADDRVVTVTTHIMTSLDLLDLVCVLNAGRLAYFGPVDELKGFFGVDDFTGIYAALDSKEPRFWEGRYKASEFSSTYLKR